MLRFIARARITLEGILKEQAELRKPAIETKAWVHQYRLSRNRATKSGYYWKRVEITMQKMTVSYSILPRCDFHYYSEDTYRQERLDFYMEYPKTVLEACTLLNAKYADHLESEIKKAEHYIRWQSERIATWKPGILVPVV